MPSIIYAGVGGTGPWSDNDYLRENGVDTFVKKLSIEWKYGAGKIYHRGPGVDGIGTNTTIVNSVVKDVLSLREKMGSDFAGIVMAGHSRGGAAVTVAAHKLQMDVDLLVLMDPVNMTPVPLSHIIPPNVKHVITPRRSAFTLSRITWGNCGNVSNPMTTTMELEIFFGTHAAIGGQEWLPNPAWGQTDDSYIQENYRYEMPTTVTFKRDRLARDEVRDWMFPKVDAVCKRLLAAHGSGAQAGQGVGQGAGASPGQNGGQSPPKNGNGKRYTVVSGDSLSLISGRFWGDVLLWPILYDANRQVVGPNPNLIHPGQILGIPDISGYSASQKNAARSRGRNC